MSVKSPIITDLTNFLEILQSKNSGIGIGEYTGKLSTIYSASQTSSPIFEKQNSTVNFLNHQQIATISGVISQLARTSLTTYQNQLTKRLSNLIQELKRSIFSLNNEAKILELEDQLKTSYSVIQKYKDNQNEFQKQMAIFSQKYSHLEENIQTFQQENKILKNQILLKNEDIQFMKKLILLANQNYQNMHQQFNNLNRSPAIKQRVKQQRSSTSIGSKSRTRLNKSSCSPSSHDPKLEKKTFDEHFRKIVMRTLKMESNK